MEQKHFPDTNSIMDNLYMAKLTQLCHIQIVHDAIRIWDNLYMAKLSQLVDECCEVGE